jgi:hypothetical protein
MRATSPVARRSSWAVAFWQALQKRSVTGKPVGLVCVGAFGIG